MSRAYSDIAFTPAVRQMQTQMGSRAGYASLDNTDDRRDELGPSEADFIASRDSFYQATVSETGWPYVQFRGGPAGFLKVLDAKTLGYADFRGNMQYISVGNIANNDRISIILMDYPSRTRLKILGRVRLVGLNDDPALMARLELPSYRARVQRGVIITVEGYDWNCPQHITPRFTEAEIAEATAPLREELAESKNRLAQIYASETAHTAQDAPREIGKGALPLVISGVRQLTPRVRAYELRTADGGRLPEVLPGAHIDVPVRLPANGIRAQSIDSTRRYSITAVSEAGDRFEIAVLHEPDGSGGSVAIHRDYQLGMTLHCGLPGNDFTLHAGAQPSVLIAGGIGITPLRAMARELHSSGRSVQLHYAVRSRESAAYHDELRSLLGPALTTYAADHGERLDVAAILANVAPDSVIYVCGPSSLLDAVLAASRNAGIDGDRLRFERFVGSPTVSTDKPVRVTLRRSGKVIDVPAQQSILDAVQAAGVDTPAACRTGTCATCAVKVVSGAVDHRDAALTDLEREQAGLICICVSRASSPELTLDL